MTEPSHTHTHTHANAQPYERSASDAHRHPAKQSARPSLMRSLGAFVGEIVRAVKTDPGQPIKPRGSGAADHSADGCGNQPTAGPDEVVVLRRTTTTVEEVCLRPQDLPRAAGGDRPRRDEGSG